MKTPCSDLFFASACRRLLSSSGLRPAAALAAVALLASVVSANESTWSGNAAANWSTAAWSPAGVPSGAEWIVNIDRSAQTANRILTIDTTSRTVGVLNALGSHDASRSNTVAASGGASLILDNGAAAARVTNAGLGNFTISAPVLLASNLELSNNPTLGQSQFLTLSGTVGAASAGLRTITTMPSVVAPSDPNFHRIVFSGSITDGAGQVAVVHNSGNNLNIQTRTNTFSGGLSINSGAVVVSGDGSGSYGDGALGASNAAINFNGGALSFSSADPAIAISQRLTTLGSGGGTIGATSASGIVTWNGNVVGTGALTKTGGGTVVLAGASNTYEGGTTVSGGTLVAASNTALGSGNVAITTGVLSLNHGVSLGNRVTLGTAGTLRAASGGTATITGTVDGVGKIGAADSFVTLASTAILAPGNSPGTLTIDGAVTLQAGSTYQWELISLVSGLNGVAGTDFDQIVISSTGALTIDAGANLNLGFGSGVAPDAGDLFWGENRSWTIIYSTAGGSVSGAHFNIDNSAWASLGSFETAYVDGSVVLNWSAAAIPEPSTYAAIFGALALLGAMVHRRRRS